MDAIENVFIKPGFGWTNLHNNKDKVIIAHGNSVNSLGNFSNAASFINEILGTCFDCKSIETKIKNCLIIELGTEMAKEVIDEMFAAGTSNNRKLKYDLMKILPKTAFKMHAHPNIEIIYIISGVLHEFRLQVKYLIINQFTSVNISHPYFFTNNEGSLCKESL